MLWKSGGSKRRLLGNKDYFLERGERVVISRDDILLDRGRDRARGQHMAVTCFYFDFAARQEETSTSLLGSLLETGDQWNGKGSRGYMAGFARAEEGR